MKFTTEYNRRKNEYYKVSKKILNYEANRKLDDNERIKQYTSEIIAVYNEFVRFIRENLPKQSSAIQRKVDSKFETFYERNFLRCLHVLKLDTVLTERYSEINLDALVVYEQEDEASGENLLTQDIFDDDLNSDDERTELEGDLQLNVDSNVNKEAQKGASDINSSIENTTAANMVLSRTDYHNMCTRTINTIYSGDPLGLQPFIDSIEALVELDETNAFTSTLKKCIFMKLSGIARDCIPNDDNGQLTIAQIKQKLKDAIKPESSVVVEGRLLALKADRTNFTDFAKKVETLAEQFQRALTLEGMPHDLANKYAIRNTIELCRSNTTMSGVKSVLSATHFDNSKEVVAKFITQSRTETGEQQVLHYRANRSNFQNRSYNQNQRGRNNNFQRNFNGQNRGGNNFNRNGYQNNQNNRNNRGNFRGRGNYRGNGYNNNYRGNNRNIMYAENGTAPPSGAAQAQNVQVNQAGNQNA